MSILSGFLSYFSSASLGMKVFLIIMYLGNIWLLVIAVKGFFEELKNRDSLQKIVNFFGYVVLLSIFPLLSILMFIPSISNHMLSRIGTVMIVCALAAIYGSKLFDD